MKNGNDIAAFRSKVKEVKPGIITLIIVCLMIFNASAADAGKKISKVKQVVRPTGYIPHATSESSKTGQQIFVKGTCTQCHSTGAVGGCLGPTLAGVGARRSAKFVENRITDGDQERKAFHKLYGQYELMPHPRLPPKQAQLVVSYLMTLPEPSGGFVLKGHARKKSAAKVMPSVGKGSVTSIQEGKKLFYSSGCMSCHSVGKIGGQFAVALDNAGAMKGRAYISERMNGAEWYRLGTNDEYAERGTLMPPSNLTQSQIESITDYLMSLSSTKSP